MSSRIFWLTALALIAAMGTAEVLTALGESQVWDEGIHISAGYAYLARGDYRWNPEHPPLAKLISALPLLALRPELPVNGEAWRKVDEVGMGVQFLYHNRIPADSILFAARSMTILLTLLFGLTFAWWMRRRFGATAALVALCLYCFDPNLIAHGRYVTTDLPVAVFYFLACALWTDALVSGRFRDLATAALAFAVAMVTKFSAILLIPTFALLYGARWWQSPQDFPLRRLVRSAAAVFGATFLLANILYWPETIRSLTGDRSLATLDRGGGPTLRTFDDWSALYQQVSGIPGPDPEPLLAAAGYQRNQNISIQEWWGMMQSAGYGGTLTGNWPLATSGGAGPTPRTFEAWNALYQQVRGIPGPDPGPLLAAAGYQRNQNISIQEWWGMMRSAGFSDRGARSATGPAATLLLRLSSHAFFHGLFSIIAHNTGGHESYLLGMRSTAGWWYYFPVVFAVKSTISALMAAALLSGAGLSLLWTTARGGTVIQRARSIPFVWIGLLLPPALYFAISMTSTINLGVRHVLPVYPFLYAAAAALLAQLSGKRVFRYAMFGFAALQVAECVSIYPDYLAFFNALSGGPRNGPQYLVDSNIDWGQDVKKLASWLKIHGTNTVWIGYFGKADVRYYGLDVRNPPEASDQKAWNEIDGFVAASVTLLNGVYLPLARLAPLRLQEPTAKIGYSIYLYDFRKRRADLGRLQ